MSRFSSETVRRRVSTTNRLRRRGGLTAGVTLGHGLLRQRQLGRLAGGGHGEALALFRLGLQFPLLLQLRTKIGQGDVILT